jgi:hypothetical protein
VHPPLPRRPRGAGYRHPPAPEVAGAQERQPQPASQRLADIILWCRESLSLQQLWPPSAGREDRAELLPKELLAPGGPLDQRPVHVFEVSDIGLQISQILSGGVRMIGTVRNSASLKSANFVGEDGWLVVCEFDPPR